MQHGIGAFDSDYSAKDLQVLDPQCKQIYLLVSCGLRLTFPDNKANRRPMALGGRINFGISAYYS